MTTDNEKPRWFFYPIWMVLSFLCIPLALFLDIIVRLIITQVVGDLIYVNGVRYFTEDYLFIYTFIPMVGLLTGILQYVLLRRYLPRMGWWVLATTGGWLLGLLLFLITIEKGFLNLGLMFLVMGLAIGIAQWLLLRRRLTQAGWWIAANVVSWGLLALVTVNSAPPITFLVTVDSAPPVTRNAAEPCASVPPTSTLIAASSSPETVKPNSSPKKMLLLYDDDGSRDGMAALLYLLSYPDISIQAITISYGEAHPKLYIQHMGCVLDILGLVIFHLAQDRICLWQEALLSRIGCVN